MIRIAHHPIYAHPLPEGHRFPMAKYELLPQQLLLEGTCKKEQFFAPKRITDSHITRTHCKDYYEQLNSLSLTNKEVRRIGFPLSAELIERECIIAQGTLEGCTYALENGVSFNIAGGTHHAFYDRAEAFCLLNDQAIAANYLLDNTLVQKNLNHRFGCSSREWNSSTLSKKSCCIYIFGSRQSKLPLPKRKE
jgi:acetoin utilization deacetylase AcuC-like enzyme